MYQEGSILAFFSRFHKEGALALRFLLSLQCTPNALNTASVGSA